MRQEMKKWRPEAIFLGAELNQLKPGKRRCLFRSMYFSNFLAPAFGKVHVTAIPDRRERMGHAPITRPSHPTGAKEASEQV